MVATGQEIVREKNSSRSGKSQGISLWVRENLHLWKKSGKSEILRVLIYLLPSQWCFCMVKNASCQCQADVRFPRKSILFPCYVKELSIHVHCVCLAESINKWVERMAMRGGWRPLSGLICEIVNSVGQGNFTFVREKSGNFKHLWLWQPWSKQMAWARVSTTWQYKSGNSGQPCLTPRFIGKKHEACPLFRTQLEMSAWRVLNHCKKLGPKLNWVRTFSR